jgi:single-strand DNA-binding protein
MSNGSGLNRWVGFCNLAADPELRYTGKGNAVLNLRVACTTTYKSGEETKENTSWLDVVVWGKRGEALEKLLGKGAPVYVEGEIRTSSYEDKDGNKRNKVEIHATEIRLTGGGSPRGEERDRGAREDDRDRRDRSRGDEEQRGRGDDRDRSRGRGDEERSRDRSRDDNTRSKREAADPWG